jgi:hypothetical protein
VSDKTRGLQRESKREENHQCQLRKIDAISLNPNEVGMSESTYRAVEIHFKGMLNVEHPLMLKDSPIPPIPR